MLTRTELVAPCTCGHVRGVHGSVFDHSTGECYEPEIACRCQRFAHRTPTPFTHWHVWADSRRVVLCREHATPTRLDMFRNRDGHNPHNPPLDPEPCEFAHCYVDRCYIGQLFSRPNTPYVTPCTPVPAPPYVGLSF